MSSDLTLCPISISDAKLFVARVHRHHLPPQGALFAVAVARADEVVGVATIGRPVARMLQDGWTAEVTRVAVVEGVPHACSMLYGAAWRACRALGYRKLITYIREDEPGTSLRAAGWTSEGPIRARSWNMPGRPRTDKSEIVRRERWTTAVGAAPIALEWPHAEPQRERLFA